MRAVSAFITTARISGTVSNPSTRYRRPTPALGVLLRRQPLAHPSFKHLLMLGQACRGREVQTVQGTPVRQRKERAGSRRRLGRRLLGTPGRGKLEHGALLGALCGGQGQRVRPLRRQRLGERFLASSCTRRHGCGARRVTRAGRCGVACTFGMICKVSEHCAGLIREAFRWSAAGCARWCVRERCCTYASFQQRRLGVRVHAFGLLRVGNP